MMRTLLLLRAGACAAWLVTADGNASDGHSTAGTRI
jgi:hypothetical protein